MDEKAFVGILIDVHVHNGIPKNICMFIMYTCIPRISQTTTQYAIFFPKYPSKLHTKKGQKWNANHE
jgi:hypothetical protein